MKHLLLLFSFINYTSMSHTQCPVQFHENITPFEMAQQLTGTQLKATSSKWILQLSLVQCRNKSYRAVMVTKSGAYFFQHKDNSLLREWVQSPDIIGHFLKYVKGNPDYYDNTYTRYKCQHMRENGPCKRYTYSRSQRCYEHD